MKLSAAEQERFLNSSELVQGSRIGGDEYEDYDDWDEDYGSSLTPMRSIVRSEDGKYYAVNWQKGSGTNENVFEDGEVLEVFPSVRLSISRETLYLTEEESEDVKPTLPEKLGAEAESYAIALGREISEPITERVYDLAGELLESLDDLKPIDIAAGAGSYREAARQYLASIVRLWEGRKL